MKKKLIGVVAVAAMTVTAGWSYNQSQNEVGMSDLALANVDALASGEDSSKGTLYGTAPNPSGQTTNCCCPGSNSCGAAACSKC